MTKVHVLVIQGTRCIKDCDGDFVFRPMIYEVEVFQTLEDLEVRQDVYREAVEKIKEGQSQDHYVFQNVWGTGRDNTGADSRRRFC